MQLIGTARLGPHLLAHAANRIGVELAEIISFRIDPAAREDRLRAALLERSVVEVGVRARGQNFERQR